jgi:hypothetical protein
MKSFFKSLVVAAAISAAGVSAQAHTVFFETFDAHPDDPTTTATQVGGEVGLTLTDFFRYDSTHLTSPYITVTPTSTTGEVTISWDFTGSGFVLGAVYIKGGSNGGNIYTISSDETVIGSGTIHTPLTGGSDKFAGISGIDFLVGTSTRVPDGGATAMLLGTALSGLALMRRKLRK